MIVVILLPDFILYKGLFMDCSKSGDGHSQSCGDSQSCTNTVQPRGPSHPSSSKLPHIVPPTENPSFSLLFLSLLYSLLRNIPVTHPGIIILRPCIPPLPGAIPGCITRNITGNNLEITMRTPPGTLWSLPLGTIPAAS